MTSNVGGLMCSIPLGIKLKLKEEAVASACVFYHTFCSAMTESEYDQHVSLLSKILHLHMTCCCCKHALGKA